MTPLPVSRPSLFKRMALSLLALAMLGGCAGVRPTVYADETPRLDLRDYFNGTIDAWGVFTDRSGKVARRFTVVIDARWQTIDGVETGTLDEHFTYADGTTERRVWTLRKVGPDRYVGTAGDVVGEARGEVAGNAFNWRYVLALKVDGRTWHVNFDDWMYLMDGQVMLNRAEMSKFGIRLGEVTLAFRKRAGTNDAG